LPPAHAAGWFCASAPQRAAHTCACTAGLIVRQRASAPGAFAWWGLCGPCMLAHWECRLFFQGCLLCLPAQRLTAPRAQTAAQFGVVLAAHACAPLRIMHGLSCTVLQGGTAHQNAFSDLCCLWLIWQPLHVTESTICVVCALCFSTASCVWAFAGSLL
jgi:hypothetical protein